MRLERCDEKVIPFLWKLLNPLLFVRGILRFAALKADGFRFKELYEYLKSFLTTTIPGAFLMKLSISMAGRMFF
ncbi:MAG TPA: hypothetical protein DCK76_08545 [Desulfotomaculum sp.]|nr:hypothetical protein [Desulfotomaculum sp.]HBY05165.1 hypothetical protein [Desulfotomaculum sp.]